MTRVDGPSSDKDSLRNVCCSCKFWGSWSVTEHLRLLGVFGMWAGKPFELSSYLYPQGQTVDDPEDEGTVITQASVTLSQVYKA
jgi:hypothetical protein